MNYEAAQAALTCARWRKSSYSQGENDCVEVATAGGWVGIRDSKTGPAGSILTFTAEQFDNLLARHADSRCSAT